MLDTLKGSLATSLPPGEAESVEADAYSHDSIPSLDKIRAFIATNGDKVTAGSETAFGLYNDWLRLATSGRHKETPANMYRAVFMGLALGTAHEASVQFFVAEPEVEATVALLTERPSDAIFDASVALCKSMSPDAGEHLLRVYCSDPHVRESTGICRFEDVIKSTMPTQTTEGGSAIARDLHPQPILQLEATPHGRSEAASAPDLWPSKRFWGSERPQFRYLPLDIWPAHARTLMSCDFLTQTPRTETLDEFESLIKDAWESMVPIIGADQKYSDRISKLNTTDPNRMIHEEALWATCAHTALTALAKNDQLPHPPSLRNVLEAIYSTAKDSLQVSHRMGETDKWASETLRDRQGPFVTGWLSRSNQASQHDLSSASKVM